ncbi:hypothetical protein SAY87_006247 [Trapa incisa]|uniref:Uncharacterized protein n=1 Tax=Trapa incisa TaxID=236973 RepID=A0AAN7KAL2_9MYRT|nr:hypothetical protein SAY87_006247 [Trapa incisa]
MYLGLREESQHPIETIESSQKKSAVKKGREFDGQIQCRVSSSPATAPVGQRSGISRRRRKQGALPDKFDCTLKAGPGMKGMTIDLCVDPKLAGEAKVETGSRKCCLL